MGVQKSAKSVSALGRRVGKGIERAPSFVFCCWKPSHPDYTPPSPTRSQNPSFLLQTKPVAKIERKRVSEGEEADGP